MPLFRKRKEVMASIKNVPRYDEVIHFMSDWIELEYEIIRSPLPIPTYGNIQVEVAKDEARISMLFPSSVNVHANFQNFVKLPINSLDSGFTPDGMAVVGLHKTIINRKYVDGFVNCMNDIYGILWKNIEALVHKTQVFPMFLTTDQLTIVVAPVFPFNTAEVTWERGKYNP